MRKRYAIVALVLIVSLGCSESLFATGETDIKSRILIVSSYHKDYTWTSQTNLGVIKALLEFGYLDNQAQADAYTQNDFVESSRAIVRKLWMDTKRRHSKSEMGQALGRVIEEVDRFKPDIILLGDDNAANFVGNHYIDTDIPIVFWGINGLPLKYGLLDSVERPGHNVTGIYQAGYHHLTIEYLIKLLPHIKKMALLSDDSPTGRAHAKRVKRYADEGSLPVDIVEVVVTNSFSRWKAKALELQDKVDAFFISTYNTLVDDDGKTVPGPTAVNWYINHIKRPETAPAKHHVMEGFLCAVDDSGFTQGYEAMKIAHKILAQGADPGSIPAFSPDHGPFILNRDRAKSLGLERLEQEHADMIDEVIETIER